MRSVFVFLILLCLLLVGCMEGRKASPLARLGVGQTSPETQLAPPTPKDTIPAPPPKIEPNLYELLGFQKGVNQIVDDFILLAVGDEKVPDRIKKPLQGDNAEAAKKCLSSLLADGTGGPALGQGLSFKDIWKDADLTQPEFDTLTTDLTGALEKNKVGETQQKMVVSVFKTLGKDVIKPAE